MVVRTKVEPIDRDVKLILDELLSPAAQGLQFAEAARGLIADADETNRRILGRVPPRTVFVDGAAGSPLESVRPGGLIVAEWELVSDLLQFIAKELGAISPVLSGRYRGSHTLFADGAEVPAGGNIPIASEYVFLSDVVYAVKIEGVPGRPPQSKQAPKGVYQVTALKAKGIHGNTARVRFEWRKPFRGGFITGRKGNKSSGRVPAIVVTVGT